MRASAAPLTAIAAVALAAGLTGCQDQESSLEPPGAELAAAASSPRSADPASSPEVVSCPRLEDQVRGITDILGYADFLVERSFHGRSNLARRQVVNRIDRAGRWAARRCTQVAAGLAPLVGATRALGDRALRRDDVRRLGRLRDSWAGAVLGQKPLTPKWEESWRSCDRFRRDVHASARLTWAPSDRGRRWWVEVSIDNGLDVTLHGNTSGTVWVKGLIEPDGSVRQAATRLLWGGSSADLLYGVRPGRSGFRPTFATSPSVPTSATGTVTVRHVWVGLWARGPDKVGCGLRVPLSA